jgi:hypothetical protein
LIDSVTSLLEKVANDANANAKGLTLAQPKAVVDALKNAASTVQEIRNTAEKGDFAKALEKAQGLQAALVQVQKSING